MGEGQRSGQALLRLESAWLGGTDLKKGADSDLASPTSSPRSSSWLRWRADADGD